MLVGSAQTIAIELQQDADKFGLNLTLAIFK